MILDLSRVITQDCAAVGQRNSARTVTVTTHYDGGGGNKVSIPESEWQETRTNERSETEALVSIGGDGGGQQREWVKVDP